MILTINNTQIPYVEDFSFVTSRYGNTEICVKFMPEHKFTYEQWLKVLSILNAGNFYYRGVDAHSLPDSDEIKYNPEWENWRAKINTLILEHSKYYSEIDPPRTDVLAVIGPDDKIFLCSKYDDDCCYMVYWGEE